MGMSEKCFGLPGRKVLPGVGVGGAPQKHRRNLGRRAGREWGPSSLLGLGVKTLPTMESILRERLTSRSIHTCKGKAKFPNA